MRILLIILGMTIVTYIPKVLPAVMLERMKFRPVVEKYLRIIPYTAMAALIFPNVINVAPEWYVGAAGAAAALCLSLVCKAPISLVRAGAIAADAAVRAYL